MLRVLRVVGRPASLQRQGDAAFASYIGASRHASFTEPPRDVATTLPAAISELSPGGQGIDTGVLSHLQAGLCYFHDMTGLPWWASIAVSTLVVRSSMLPLVWFQTRHVGRLGEALPTLKQLTSLLKNSLQRPGQQQHVSYGHFTVGVKSIFKLHKFNPSLAVAAPLLNASLFLSFVLATRQMVRSAVPGLEEGGILWFENLSAVDGTGALPLIAIAASYGTMDMSFGNQEALEKSPKILFFKSSLQSLLIFSTPLVLSLPQGVFMYWIPSTLFTACQHLYRRKAGEV